MDKLISQQAAIDTIKKRLFETAFNNVGIKQNIDETLVDVAENRLENWFDELPSIQPSHNITMNDVLKYIDGMPEDVWQEFTACLECRGWELQRRTAKWCGGDFA